MTEEFFMPEERERFFGRIREIIGVEGKRVLDVGGAGEEALFARKMEEWGADVTVLDNSERRLNRCPVKGILADASSIPLPDRSFDVVSAFLMLHEVPPQLHFKVIAEMKRVGGRMVILEREPSIPSSPDEERLQDLAERLAESVGETEKTQPKDYWISMLYDMEVQSYDFVLVYENELELDEGYIRTVTESRGYPEELVREYVAQARVVEQQMRREGRMFEDSLYLIIGKHKT